MVIAAMKLKDAYSLEGKLWPTQHSKKQKCHFADKGLSSQGYGFSSSHVCESWTIKMSAEELTLLNYGVGEDSSESLGQQGDPTSPS